MSLSPFLKSPFTDLTGVMVSHQWYGSCAEKELRALDCLEAYGIDKGMQKCTVLLKDFEECALKHKQRSRVFAMKMERYRQYVSGERSKEERYAPAPPGDSY